MKTSPTKKSLKTLYVSDLDGTLLNNQSRLSTQTIKQLNFLIQQQGAQFTIATARTPATVSNLMKEVKTNLPYIVMAGAAMWDNTHQKYTEVHTIKHKVVEQLLKLYEPKNIHPFIYRQHGNCIYAQHVSQMTIQEKDFITQRLKSPLKKLFIEEKIDIPKDDNTLLVYSMGNYDAMREIADKIEELNIACTQMCYHDIFDHSQGYLEIYAKDTTKASAIKQLAKKINAGRIVVFGDNLNDIPMMQAADYSIAVSNAFNEVKAQADEIIKSNDEDAVVDWIVYDINH